MMTKRLLKEGLLHCLSKTPASRITVSELCKESGVNRATFYNHYETPIMLLREISYDYADKLKNIYYTAYYENPDNMEKATLKCLEYLYEKKEEVKTLFSPNAENSLRAFGMEIIRDTVEKDTLFYSGITEDNRDEVLLESVITASAAFSLIQIWLSEEINKTPQEVLDLLKKCFHKKLFQC